MEISNQNQAPWNDAHGQLLTDLELKKVSAAWDAETWERFLASTVDRDMSDNESVCDDYEFNLEEELPEPIWVQSSDLPEVVHRAIHAAIRSLTERQRSVVRGIYFHSCSHGRVARNLRIARQTVSETKIISLKEIKRLLALDPAVASYLIGGSANLPAKKLSPEQMILEVYRADLNGSYMK